MGDGRVRAGGASEPVVLHALDLHMSPISCCRQSSKTLQAPFISICNQAKVSLRKCQTLTRLFVCGNYAQNLFIICLFCGISRCGLLTQTHSFAPLFVTHQNLSFTRAGRPGSVCTRQKPIKALTNLTSTCGVCSDRRVFVCSVPAMFAAIEPSADGYYVLPRMSRCHRRIPNLPHTPHPTQHRCSATSVAE